MTREEILAMSAGRELNAHIAEKVLGWISWEEKRGEYTYIVFQKPDEREPYRKSQNWEAAAVRYRQIDFTEIDYQKHIVTGIKDYSSDISAAWEVVVNMSHAKTDKSFRLDLHYMTYFASFGDTEAKARTAPEAICKAAILATIGG